MIKSFKKDKHLVVLEMLNQLSEDKDIIFVILN